MIKITNKSVDVVVEAHYDHKKDLDSTPVEDTSWEENSNYVQKGLLFFLENKEVGYPWEKKKHIIKIFTF